MKTLLATATLLLSATAAFADTIVIDSFTDGSSFTLSDSSGTAKFNYLTGASGILGGSREIRVRAGGSGFYGSTNIAVNTSAGTLTSFGGDTDTRAVEYGTAIGIGGGPGTPVQLNFNLNLVDAFEFDVSAIGIEGIVQLSILTGGNTYSAPGVLINGTGTYSVGLDDFIGLTEGLANDIDGIMLSASSKGSSAGEGMVLSELRVVTSAIPEPASFAAIAGLGVLGLAAFRRRRAA